MMNTNRKTTICCWRLANYLSGTSLHCQGVLLSALLSLFAFPALAKSPIILLVESGTAPVYQEVSSTVISSLDMNCPECKTYQIKQLNLDETPVAGFLNSEDSGIKLIVSIGVKAARLISASETSIPRLSTLIPKSSATSLQLDQSSKNVSAIYLDQPVSRQLNLVKLITADNQVLGVLFGPATIASRTTLEMAAINLGIPVQTETATADDEIGPALKRLLESSNIILALPDPLIYNRNTIFNILLSSYHNRIPVIGFSVSYVKAGAMLAIHSTPQEIGRHIADSIRQFVIAGGNQLPAPEFPRYFSIEVNNSVAHSLDIDLPAATELKQYLEQMEGQ